MNTTAAAPPSPAPAELRGPITVAKLRAWVREAQPGARLVYARGPAAVLHCGAAVMAEVQRIGAGVPDDRGGCIPGLELVRAHFMRGAQREGLYVVCRSNRPVRAGELP